MEREYYQDGKNRFLRIPAINPEAASFRVRMINANQPPFLLRIHEVHEGANSFYDYNISGLVSLSDCPTEKIQETYLLGVLYTLKQISGEIEELLLDAKEVVLSPEMIFIEPAKERFFFCYYPNSEETVQSSLETLMEYFLKRLSPRNQGEMLLLYGLYQRSREPNVTFGSLEEYWRSLNQEEEHPQEEISPSEIFQGEIEPVSFRNHGEDKAVFEELGLEIGPVESAYIEWKDQRKVEQKERTPILLEDEQNKKVSKEETDISNSKFKGIALKLKNYAFEICIGLVVGTGVIIMLLT